MESKKSMSPILIVILSVLGTCLAIFGAWYGINYFKGEDKPTNDWSQKIDNTSIPSNVRTDTDENKSTRIFDVSITNKQKEVYKSLITSSNEYGFYSNKSIDINSITVADMLKYAIEEYIHENNIAMNYDVYCIVEQNNYCDNGHIPVVNKATIDEYIKSKFNTSRVFSLDENDKSLYIEKSRYVIGDIGGFNTGTYIYDLSSQKYYFGYLSKSGNDKDIFVELTRVEENENNIYFYDKAFVADYGLGDGIYFSSFDDDFLTIESDTINSSEIDNYKEIYFIKELNNGELSYSSYVNAKYVFEKYADKIHSYKHTFKKVNGKYYWVSTEVVK